MACRLSITVRLCQRLSITFGITIISEFILPLVISPQYRKDRTYKMWLRVPTEILDHYIHSYLFDEHSWFEPHSGGFDTGLNQCQSN